MATTDGMVREALSDLDARLGDLRDAEREDRAHHRVGEPHPPAGAGGQDRGPAHGTRARRISGLILLPCVLARQASAPRYPGISASTNCVRRVSDSCQPR
jgi:hypothetical protein